MDGRGRLAKPLNDGSARARRRTADLSIGWRRALRHWFNLLFDLQLPRGIGIAATALLLLTSAGYGVVCGDLGSAIAEELTDARDAAANALGLRLSSVALAGQNRVTQEEIFAAVGVTGRSSLLFLDAGAARARLKTNPWIAEATVLKLYPGRLHIAITERDALALWQKDRKIWVIANDGVVLEPYVSAQFSSLPLVVGIGAELKAREFLSLIDKYPSLRAQLFASILVAERRWNLKLRNGVDVRLPESGIEQALDALLELDREKKLISRDIIAIDLRLPDRVTVRLSQAAAQVREETLREREKENNKKNKRKGGDA